MIMRIWRGRTPADKADAYLEITRRTAIPDYRSVPGCLGAWVTRRIEGDVAHFQTVTLWENLEVIEGFAGKPVDTAKYYDFDDDYLLEKAATVEHWEAWDTV